MSESIESIMAMLQAMYKEQQAQNEQVMQRISGMEEQLRDSASKDDMREIQGRVNIQISGITTQLDYVTKCVRVKDWEAL